MSKSYSTIKRCAAALLATLMLSSAAAQVPLSGDATPGWYRMRLGAFEITALTDGTLELPADKVFMNIAPDRVRALLANAYLTKDVQVTVNAFLVNTGKKLVLIDAGTGKSQIFGAKLGKLVTNLLASGYSPEQVEEIYVTHMHTDHIGGLTAGDGKRNFPNAIVRANSREADFYLSQAKLDAAPADEKEDLASAIATFKPYVAAKRFKTFDGETQLTPGIRAIPALGHTPGHTIYAVESQGERLVIWGDLLHVAAIQFPQPSATVRFDWNTSESPRVRSKHFLDAATKGYYVAAAHVAFPGIGKLRAAANGYAWVPIAYIFGN